MLALAAAVAALDQGTKLWALARLAGRPPVVLPGGWVELWLVSNPGAAFSFGMGATWVFTVFAAAVVVIVPWLAARARFRGQQAVLGLLLGGVVGNLLDRLVRAPGPGSGRVIDFIDYHGWVVGNIADIAIVASACLLIVRALTAPGHQQQVPVPRPGQSGHP